MKIKMKHISKIEMEKIYNKSNMIIICGNRCTGKTYSVLKYFNDYNINFTWLQRASLVNTYKSNLPNISKRIDCIVDAEQYDCVYLDDFGIGFDKTYDFYMNNFTPNINHILTVSNFNMPYVFDYLDMIFNIINNKKYHVNIYYLS